MWGVVFSLLAVFVVLKPVTSEAWTAAAPAAEAQEDSRKCSGRSPVDVYPSSGSDSALLSDVGKSH